MLGAWRAAGSGIQFDPGCAFANDDSEDEGTLASGISQLATMTSAGTGVTALTSGTTATAQGTW